MHAETDTVTARRQFLKKCGKFAIVTPPAVALMLSAEGSQYTAAASGFGRGDNGFGNGGGDGVPGRSGSSNSPNADEFSEDRVR